MRSIKDRILVDYKPQAVQQLDNGLYVSGEDSFNFLELEVLGAGLGCKNIQDGDLIVIRKEDLLQTEVFGELLFLTKEEYVLKRNMKVYNKNILLKPIVEEVTKSGLILPIDSSSSKQKGVVIEVGNEVEQIQVGDEVVIGKNSAIEIEEFLIVREDEVVVVLNR